VFVEYQKVQARERSSALNNDALCAIPVRRFTGKYDGAANPLWTSGDLVVETVYRFKGQSAPVIVLCEVDFENLTERELHKLFVGFTRAQFQLECVLSERAANLLMQRAG
jgi:superfamily I DNA and RNA helicase